MEMLSFQYIMQNIHTTSTRMTTLSQSHRLAKAFFVPWLGDSSAGCRQFRYLC